MGSGGFDALERSGSRKGKEKARKGHAPRCELESSPRGAWHERGSKSGAETCSNNLKGGAGSGRQANMHASSSCTWAAVLLISSSLHLPPPSLACPQYLSQWVSHIGVDPSALQQLASQTPTAEAAVV